MTTLSFYFAIYFIVNRQTLTSISCFFDNRGVKRFYTHQAEAMDAVFNGSSIVAATPTASGKSMTYIVPVRCLDGVVSVLISLSLPSANLILRNRSSDGGSSGNVEMCLQFGCLYGRC